MEATLENTWFSSHAFHGIADFVAQVREIEATNIAQLDPFQVGPQLLTTIQLGCIGLEPPQMDAVSRAVRQKSLNHVTAGG